MGRLAVIFEDHYKKHLPKAYAAIGAKPAFFAELEREAEQQIETLADALEGETPEGGETFHEAMSRMTTARSNAESDVLRDMLPPAETDAETLDPADAELDEALAEFRDAKTEFEAARVSQEL